MSAKQKPEHDVPTMPSVFFTDGMRLLRLEKEADTELGKQACEKADTFQLRHCPGRPHITMAAVAYMLTFKLGSRRNLTEVAKAFCTTEGGIRDRLKQIRLAGKEG